MHLRIKEINRGIENGVDSHPLDPGEFLFIMPGHGLFGSKAQMPE